ncbi:MAG: DsbA family protein [Armatimonadota bacterium]
MRKPPPLELSGHSDERNYKSDHFTLGSLTSITLYHDFLCPWCWVGFLQAKRLAAEYRLAFDWRGAELMPANLPHTPAPPKPVDPGAPPPPPAAKSRFDLFVESEGFVMPTPRPPFVRTHNALLGAEWARAEGPEAFDAYNEAVYRAYWEQGLDISDPEVLRSLADSHGLNGAALTESIRAERYAENILPFDDDAYATGIRHVPTFIFGAEEFLAEANYTDLAHAAERFLFRLERHRAKKG